MARYAGGAASDLAVDDAGNVYVSAWSPYSDDPFRPSFPDYATVKYSARGDEIWVARYGGRSRWQSIASAVVVDRVGNVYVTGTSNGGYATIKYAQVLEDFRRGDCNADSTLDISDAVFALNHLFLGGPPPAAPYPECGTSDLEADEALGCEESLEHCP